MARANIVIKKTDNYEEALYEMKKYGAKMEQLIRSERKRAVIIVLGVFLIDAVIAMAGSSMGMRTFEILHTIGFTVPISAPLIGYGIAKILDDGRRIRVAGSYQDGSRFAGMTEQEVIDYSNEKSDVWQQWSAKENTGEKK